MEEILAHAEPRPDESLGVIAMDIRHAQRVEVALHSALASRLDPYEFFSPDREERFFVKNLGRVQRDERDAINRRQQDCTQVVTPWGYEPRTMDQLRGRSGRTPPDPLTPAVPDGPARAGAGG